MNIKVIKVLIYLLFSFSAVCAQQNQDLPAPPEEKFVCDLRQPPLIQFDVSVVDVENNHLKNLTYRDFKVYDEKEVYEIESFKFDELKNQYVIGVYKNDFGNESDWHNMKIKVKLSEEKKENCEKIFIRASKAYCSNQN